MDTIMGKNSTGYLVTLVERKSKLTLIKRVPDKQADQMVKAIVQLLRPYEDNVFTITADNGKEFALHKKYQRLKGRYLVCSPV